MLPRIHRFIPGGDPDFCICTIHKGYLGHAEWLQTFSKGSENRDKNLYPEIWTSVIIKETEMGEQILKTGEKKDEGKPRWELVGWDAIEGLVKVLTMGAKKYQARNWELGIEYGRVYGAILRHLTAFWRGESTDPESGLSHLDHALCELMFLSSYEKRGMKSFDDRPSNLLCTVSNQQQTFNSQDPRLK